MSRDISQSINSHTWKEYLAVQNTYLPEIPEVEQVSERVIRIQAGNPGEVSLSELRFVLKLHLFSVILVACNTISENADGCY